MSEPVERPGTGSGDSEHLPAMDRQRVRWTVDNMDRAMAEAYVSLFRRWLDADDRLVRIIPKRAAAVLRAGLPADLVRPLVDEAELRLNASSREVRV